MTIKQALIWGVKNLKKFNSSALDAEVLLLFVLKQDKTWLFSHINDDLSAKLIARYKKLIFRRKKVEPIAYITHHKEFYGLDFYVNKSVLIPRPETELLVEEALKFKIKRPKILDVGTGSGNIIISIAKNKKGDFYASDISSISLKIAQKNAKKHKFKINFIKSDLFANIPNIKFDIIVANLPYLEKKWIKNNLKFEPRQALDGGTVGTKIIEQFLSQAGNYLSKNGIILTEVDPRQKNKIEELTKKYLLNKKTIFKRDLQGLIRVAKIH